MRQHKIIAGFNLIRLLTKKIKSVGEKHNSHHNKLQLKLLIYLISISHKDLKKLIVFQILMSHLI